RLRVDALDGVEARRGPARDRVRRLVAFALILERALEGLEGARVARRVVGEREDELPLERPLGADPRARRLLPGFEQRVDEPVLVARLEGDERRLRDGPVLVEERFPEREA